MESPGVTLIQPSGPTLAPSLLDQVEAIFFEASGRTFVPGPEPATPLSEYQPPFLASHVCQAPVTTVG